MTKQSSSPERVSFWDTFNSMTGYEEDAVEAAFGVSPGELTVKSFGGNLNVGALRAMVFVLATRDGEDAAKAKDTAMALTRKALNDRFLSEEEDADDAIPEEPDTEQGKDDSPDA